MMQSSVHYLGPPGSHTHQACLNHFPQSPLSPCASIDQVLNQTSQSSDQNRLGFVPIENSTFGPVLETLDSLNSHSLLIIDQVQMPIRHSFLSNASVGLEESDLRLIDKVYSHPQVSDLCVDLIQQALGQCAQWLRNHVPHAEQIPCASTSKAAQLASADPCGAAICSFICSELYNLRILFTDIQDASCTPFVR